MKKIIAFIAFALLLIFATAALAAPFVVCDPQAGVTHYKLTGPAWVPATVPAQPDGSLKLDVAASVDGVNAITVAACIAAGPQPDGWPVERCSIFVPFSFTRPSPPASTKAIRLTP